MGKWYREGGFCREGMGVETVSVVKNENVDGNGTVNSLRSKNESLKSDYTMSCAGYNNLFGDLTRAKELEMNLSKKVTSLEREKVGLRRDLEWVMRKAIPRMLAKVLRSEQFDNEMMKVQKVLIYRGRDLGRQEARDLLMCNQRVSAFDLDLPRKAKDVVRGLKKIKWKFIKTILSSPDLSFNLLRGVLDRGDSSVGEGSSSRLLAIRSGLLPQFALSPVDVLQRYHFIDYSLASYAPLTWLVTSSESVKTDTWWTSSLMESSKPAINASYSDSLLEVGNSNRRAYVI
ncbi:hypothetical protein Tco_0115864 [Tanacetum coccineum]